MRYNIYRIISIIKKLLFIEASSLKNTSINSSCNFSINTIVDASYGYISIDEKCTFHSHAMIVANGGPITIGARCSVNPYSILYSGKAGLVIGNDVRIAAHVVIIPENHVFERSDVTIRSQGTRSKGIFVGSDVWIGTGAKILDGVSIGNGCVIGANAVVTKNLPPYSVAVGNPAKVIRSRIKTDKNSISL